MTRLDQEARAVLVNSAGNDGGVIDRYPKLFASPRTHSNPYDQIHNMIIVGAVDEMGVSPDWSQTADFVTTYAPGVAVRVPALPRFDGDDDTQVDEGTSYCKFNLRRGSAAGSGSRTPCPRAPPTLLVSSR